MEGRLLVKGRAHEALVADFGLQAAARGFTTATTVHPRDLVLRRGEDEWLVEAKLLYNGNSTQAVREAVGQLLEYSYFLYAADKLALVALFSEEVGDAHVEYLESLRIQSVSRVSSGWCGSASAVASGLL